MRRGSARGACTIAAREPRPKASRPSSSTAKLRLLLNTRGNGCAGSRPIGVSTGRSSRKKNSRIHWRCAGFHSSRRGKTMPSRASAGSTMSLSSLYLAATSACASRLTASDRKSTRLNSSHRCISYAVFCLKKKKKKYRKNITKKKKKNIKNQSYYNTIIKNTLTTTYTKQVYILISSSMQKCYSIQLSYLHI